MPASEILRRCCELDKDAPTRLTDAYSLQTHVRARKRLSGTLSGSLSLARIMHRSVLQELCIVRMSKLPAQRPLVLCVGDLVVSTALVDIVTSLTG